MLTLVAELALTSILVGVVLMVVGHLRLGEWISFLP